MRNTLICLVCSYCLIACSGPAPATPVRTDGFSQAPKTPEDSMMQEVMDDHDAAMAKMGRLTGDRKRAIHLADSMTAAKIRIDKSRIASLRELATELEHAENNMNKWMEGFSMDSATGDHSRRLEYLQAEKAKVSVVKDEVLSAISKADSLLGK